ncbi:2-hydroxychromene-2-carboxylate isomerase [Pacificitalea manganoxidans]|uniref:2-hydroxychromene-2-carboxylate isomerase n=1 Tax=Pacificitalea manganoxidans TaxID=1411902 RepID=A0A291M1E4_9RHOB|nr:2-hydroxychromene-2-carboxylate isomerase [Pacificitalea manganoxidans]ATI42710.1 2-hydroxychromene-2-carboxylate isomerase [Pacificitalea manganoxidans]MAQ46909.1 2-hydroxychromene-2-carboxylate isomerase [Actibacterium sp.]MDR6307397.1 2-hydroxychromene-2-carboxylate isomerase [Pacificitalea manganoxidans]OWU68904.1 2-hydroxychromene-2-carboxylate isomerase [Roseovarius sp. 22II1-1F6A]|tara:strand:+ start:433 stop:1032 length:600 start_codon:yes stop_codon:yes gene_type:complete
MARIDYYFATISPFTYLAGPRFADLVDRHGLDVTYRPLDIMALFPRTGGLPPGERHPSRLAFRAQDLPRQARKAGMELNLKPAHFPTNMAPSSYAVIAAQQTGGGDVAAVIRALSRACWAEEKDIADDQVIRAALEEGGFDPDLADRGMLAGAEEYSRNLEDAVQAGVFGAPFWITEDDQRFWGQDRLEDLDLHLQGKL